LLEHNIAAKDLENYTNKRLLVVQARWILDEKWETKRKEKFYSSTLGQVKSILQNDTPLSVFIWVTWTLSN
jgi:hypothetical protein